MDEFKNHVKPVEANDSQLSVEENKLNFLLTEPDRVEDGEGDWSFSIFVDNVIFLACFSYASQADAMRGRIAMEEALKDAVFIATSQS